MSTSIVFAVIIPIGIATVLVLWHVGKQPYKFKNVSQQDLRRFLHSLLQRGYDKGFVIVEIPKDPRFVQFSKYVFRKGVVGLKLRFPLADWTAPYYEALKQNLEQRAILTVLSLQMRTPPVSFFWSILAMT